MHLRKKSDLVLMQMEEKLVKVRADITESKIRQSVENISQNWMLFKMINTTDKPLARLMEKKEWTDYFNIMNEAGVFTTEAMDFSQLRWQ